jgi:hypothetical protein
LKAPWRRAVLALGVRLQAQLGRQPDLGELSEDRP